MWGAFANWAFAASTPEKTAGVLRPLVVISGVGLLIALAQLPLYYLAAYWIKTRK